MSRGTNLFVAALAGAVVAALIANFLQTEKGKELLQAASSSLKDLTDQATQYAKSNLGEIVRETKNSLQEVVKEKILDVVRK
jgi:gas vesicle protein